MNWEQKYDALASMIEGYRRERDEAREQLYLTKAELGRWVDRETKAVRERDEAREERDLARERFENAVQSATRYAVERDEWRDKFIAVNQTAGELCNACGWAFKIPGESCRCEVVKERDDCQKQLDEVKEELRALTVEHADESTLCDNALGHLERVTRERDEAQEYVRVFCMAIKLCADERDYWKAKAEEAKQ